MSKMAIPPILLRFMSIRTFYTIPSRLSKYDVREGKVMRKIMNGSLSKKKLWYKLDGVNNANAMAMPKPTSFHVGRSSRRVAVLNKLFMKHITDLMATGEVAAELLGRGIEISRVKVAPDFTRINVYWLAKGTKHDANTEVVLSRNAGNLRHELSQLRLIGAIPLIEFVKDNRYGKYADVELLLAKADFGDDYIPVDSSHLLKSEFILNTRFSSDVKATLESEHPDSECYEEMPPMRMDVFGLNHSDIMTKVQKSVKKSQALHRKEPNSVSETTEVDQQTTQYENIDPRKVDMVEFLLKRQRSKQKVLRGTKNYQPELELHEKEWEDSELMDNFLKEIDELDLGDESDEVGNDDHYEKS